MKDYVKDRQHKDSREERRKGDREDRYTREKRHRDDKDHKHKRKQRSPSREPREKKYRRNDDSPHRDNKMEKPGAKADTEAEGNQEKLSLSIEETNKLRAKLGLKPLTVDDDREKGEPKTATDRPDVHVPAINIGVVKKNEEMREKLQMMKEKRRLEQTLFKGKTLAEEDDGESAALWVEKTRRQEVMRKEADERAKVLDQMDEEFGVKDLIEKEFTKETKNSYKASDLKGLKIEHSSKDFMEGRNVILTLKDKGVLEEGDDVLVNVNMVDDEKALQNVENKKNKPDYNPYDEPEYDEQGNLKTVEILSKYDDEIRGGPKKEYFMIGDNGQSRSEKKMSDGSRPGQIADSLMLSEHILASDYYTNEEIVKFKKSNKSGKKSLRKKVKVTADDLLALASNEEAMEQGEPENGVQVEKSSVSSQSKIEIRTKMDDEDDLLGADENFSAPEDRTWLDLELASSRARSRKMNFENVLGIKQESTDEAGVDFSGSTFYMNSTAEFCRSVGDFLTSSTGQNPTNEEEDDDMNVVQSNSDETVQTGWQSVEVDEKPMMMKVEDNPVLDEEPIIDQGLGAALKLASKKGYLESLVAKQLNISRHSKLEALNYSIEDKKMDELDDKYSGRRSKYSAGSGGGPIVDFREKDGYKPEIKLEYVDDQGREMSKKEAFRYLSHKFHGKGSGKKKLEKRMKKAEEDALMRSMSSTDTPLNTVQLLQEKQKANRQPYVILSGGKGLVTNIITK